MTRSSRRANKIAGKSKWLPSDKTCIECGGPLAFIRGITYTCTKCGLMQEISKDES